MDPSGKMNIDMVVLSWQKPPNLIPKLPSMFHPVAPAVFLLFCPVFEASTWVGSSFFVFHALNSLVLLEDVPE